MSKENFAVILTGGKQYRVGAGYKLMIEKLAGEAGHLLKFDKVLLKTAGSKTEIGTPFVPGAVVEAEILRQTKDEKKIVFRYHSKTRYRKFKGHRQPNTEIRIKAIN